VRLRAVRAHSVKMGPDKHCCRSSWPIRNVPASQLHSRSLPMRTKLGDQQYAKHGGLVLSIPYRSWSTGLSDQRLVGLTSASLVVWHRSSSPTLDYCFKYRTEVYRPLRKSTVPIIDRDTNPYRFHLSINFTDLPTLVSGPENSTTVRGADAQPRYVLPSIQPYTRRVCCITIRTACHAT